MSASDKTSVTSRRWTVNAALLLLCLGFPCFAQTTSETDQSPQTFKGHTDRVNSVAFSPDGKMLVGGSEDNTVRLWEVATGKLLRTISHNGKVRSVAFSPDGKILASGSGPPAANEKKGKGDGPGAVQLWNSQTGQLIRTMRSRWVVWCIAFSPDGKILAGGTGSLAGVRGETILWSVRTGQLIKTLRPSRGVSDVEFSPDGKILASGNGYDDSEKYAGDVKLWNVRTGRLKRVLRADDCYPVDSVAIASNGQILASGTVGNVRLWNLQAGKQVRMLSGFRMTSVVFSPDGKMLAYTNEKDGTYTEVNLCDTQTGKLKHLLSSSGYGRVGHIAFSPDGKMLAGASDSNEVILWQIK